MGKLDTYLKSTQEYTKSRLLRFQMKNVLTSVVSRAAIGHNYLEASITFLFVIIYLLSQNVLAKMLEKE